MPIKRLRTLILVADSSRAHAVVRSGHEASLEAVEGLDLKIAHPHGRDLLTDRPGKIQESHGLSRHAIEPHTDPVREAERRFANRVVHGLDRRFDHGEFDNLILIAGPRTLGDLRDFLPKRLAAILKAELARDLTHLTNADLKQHLDDAGV
jgi:protein required for attachment to host cells